MWLLDIFQIKNFKSRISTLENEISLLQADLKFSKNKIQELEDFIHIHAPLFDPNTLPSHGCHENALQCWESAWKRVDHSNPEQVLRQNRAAEAVLTPLSVDREKGIAYFQGYSSEYTTSLKSCECMDFRKRIYPCKHIYRLAHELGVFPLNAPVEYVDNPRGFFSKDRLKYTICLLSEKHKRLLSSVLSSGHIVAPYLEARKLIDLNLVSVDPNLRILLNTYKRDELLSMLPPSSPVKRSAKKSDIIEGIIRYHPDAVSSASRELQKVVITVSPYISRYKHYIWVYLN